ncbi:MAG: hypothetical protein V7L00_16845 [Nostoc sp.]|uniref:hypothetical protein n=1 Tax=Nostoc sp. TaxID=1180 RepID=UPI002FF802BF
MAIAFVVVWDLLFLGEMSGKGSLATSTLNQNTKGLEPFSTSHLFIAIATLKSDRTSPPMQNPIAIRSATGLQRQFWV